MEYYEFFSGGGMAHAGLQDYATCTYANDIDARKAAVYASNWRSECLDVRDISVLDASNLPGKASMAWASFPCQDLSLAGTGTGLNGARSGTFYAFCKLMQGLARDGRAPKVLVLENVCGALSSRKGADFASICSALVNLGYYVGAVVMDAIHFVPQSRPRLFVIATSALHSAPGAHLVQDGPESPWHPPSLIQAVRRLDARVCGRWIWWHLPVPAQRTGTLEEVLEDEPRGVSWHSHSETMKLLSMMSDDHLRKVHDAMKAGGRQAGAIYKRTRRDATTGLKVQRAEIRLDGVAGCIRTAKGGSSRQILMIIEGDVIRSRLLSPREGARLMGLPDSYKLPPSYTEAFQLLGDGVVVPVVRHLTKHLLYPLIAGSFADYEDAA